MLLAQANALRIPLPDESVHCVVTSPPYWGLRDYGIAGQLGLEPTPEQYVENMVTVFREVRRVLRGDGVCWLNLGDSYAASATGNMGNKSTLEGGKATQQAAGRRPSKSGNGLKPKDLCGIPWRVAFALQADGWWLRSDIIWHKPNPMPESVTDRPTKAHEYLFLLTKRARYFYDADAVREPQTESTRARALYGWSGRTDDGSNGARSGSTFKRMAESGEPIATIPASGYRNRRTVWTIATKPYSGAHFACYPPALVEPCIKAGTSERGVCPVCGAPWERVVETPDFSEQPRRSTTKGDGTPNPRGFKTSAGQKWQEWRNANPNVTHGFRPTCDCIERDSTSYGGPNDVGEMPQEPHPPAPIPATVLDPFVGSGTTLQVARALGRRGVGLDLSYSYLHDQARVRLGLAALAGWGHGIDGNNGNSIETLPLFAGVS